MRRRIIELRHCRSDCSHSGLRSPTTPLGPAERLQDRPRSLCSKPPHLGADRQPAVLMWTSTTDDVPHCLCLPVDKVPGGLWALYCSVVGRSLHMLRRLTTTSLSCLSTQTSFNKIIHRSLTVRVYVSKNLQIYHI